MKAAMLYLLAALMLALIVAVAWWQQLATQPKEHTIRSGETLASIATDLGVEPVAIAEVNGAEVDEIVVRPGETILVPTVPETGAGVWLAHLAGVVAEIGGVLLSFWLGLVAGIVPRAYRQRILGISAALGVASYAASHAGVEEAISVTPGFIFDSVKDGFMWAAAFPLFAAAFGMRDREGAAAGGEGGSGAGAGAGAGGAGGGGGGTASGAHVPGSPPERSAPGEAPAEDRSAEPDRG